MLSYTTFFLTLTTLLPLTTCHPNTPRSTGVIHRIFAGSTTANAGLHFEPENVVAEIGDLIEFHFLPKNHSVVQSSFDAPCEPLGGDSAVFSGFNFKTDAGESDKVFSFVVKDTLPFWYYCSQPTGEHCKKGMSGVINQNFNSDKTLAAYKEKAKGAAVKQPSANPLASQVGAIMDNVSKL